ncbi:MAG: hypothetical protein WBQ94_02480 [Terracidiphilus sp.]
MTGTVLVLWAVWGAFVLLTLILKIYASRLSRDEDDHLVLDEAFSQMKTEQAAIIARVNRIQPVQRVVLVLTGIMTLVVIGYYALDVINQFK